jgi:hypothetical protein
MRKFIVFLPILLLMCVISAHAQTVCPPMPAGTVCILQSDSDRIAKDLAELKAARPLIAAYANERGATDIERAAYKNALSVAETAIGILQKGIADRDALVALQEKAMQSLMALNDQLLKQINKPRSAWQKLLATMKEILTLAAGVAIGHGL